GGNPGSALPRRSRRIRGLPPAQRRRDPFHRVGGPVEPPPQVRDAPLLQRAGRDLARLARRSPADPRGQSQDRPVAPSPLHAPPPRAGPPRLPRGRPLLRRRRLETGRHAVRAHALIRLSLTRPAAVCYTCIAEGQNACAETATEGRETARGSGSENGTYQEPLREARDHGFSGGPGRLSPGHRSSREKPARHPHRGSGATAWPGRLSLIPPRSRSYLVSTHRFNAESYGTCESASRVRKIRAGLERRSAGKRPVCG